MAASETVRGVLRNLRIKRVALVPMGANFDKKTGDGAHIMLYKGAPDVGSVHVDSTEWESEYEKANLDAYSRNALPDSAFAAVWTDSAGKKHRKLPIHDAGHLAAARGRIDEADIPADVKAAARRKIENAGSTSKSNEDNMKKTWGSVLKGLVGLAAEPDAAKRAEALGELTKAFPDDNDEDDKPVHKADDPMCKCADCMAKGAQMPDITKSAEFMKAVNDAVAAQTTDIQKRLQAEVDIRETAEVRTILKSFKATSLDIEKELPTYLALRKSNPAAFDSVIKTLQTQDAQLADSRMLQDFGTRRGAGEGSAWAQIEAKAEALIEKSSDGKLTKAMAIERVMEQNPKLVKAYRAEQQ